MLLFLKKLTKVILENKDKKLLIIQNEQDSNFDLEKNEKLNSLKTAFEQDTKLETLILSDLQEEWVCFIAPALKVSNIQRFILVNLSQKAIGSIISILSYPRFSGPPRNELKHRQLYLSKKDFEMMAPLMPFLSGDFTLSNIDDLPEDVKKNIPEKRPIITPFLPPMESDNQVIKWKDKYQPEKKEKNIHQQNKKMKFIFVSEHPENYPENRPKKITETSSSSNNSTILPPISELPFFKPENTNAASKRRDISLPPLNLPPQWSEEDADVLPFSSVQPRSK
ncbi:MAG: hypothetical protein WBE18_05330 [Gammaproteobacteria bacterium]